MDDIRSRFQRDRVMTATPAQRIVLLYDRLVLDLTRARDAEDTVIASPHLRHASAILSELLSSLDQNAGGPTDGLASIYLYGLREVMSAQLSGFGPTLNALLANLVALRDAWQTIADGGAGTGAATPAGVVNVPAASVTAVSAVPGAGLSLTA